MKDHFLKGYRCVQEKEENGEPEVDDEEDEEVDEEDEEDDVEGAKMFFILPFRSYFLQIVNNLLIRFILQVTRKTRRKMKTRLRVAQSGQQRMTRMMKMR